MVLDSGLLVQCDGDTRRCDGAAGALVDNWLDISLGMPEVVAVLAPGPPLGGLGGGGGIIWELVLRDSPVAGLGMTGIVDGGLKSA